MRKPLIACQCFAIIALNCHIPVVLADTHKFKAQKHVKSKVITEADCTKSPVVDRVQNEQKIPLNYIGIAFHNPNYILPYYYTVSPYNAVYRNNTPDDESLNHTEFKYQFSVKVPIWKNILHYPTALYAAYTQLTYWQVYNKQAFIRENDYEPEFFLATKVKWHLFNDWNVNLVNVGVDHVSNGFGTELQRSWNRAYIEAVASSEHWMLSLKPWYVISTNDNNTNIAQYLGYGSILVAYKYQQHVVALKAHSIVEQGARRATGELTWSFPITHYIKGYVQGFSGYGQSLIEYDHRTNSIGLGLALSDWI